MRAPTGLSISSVFVEPAHQKVLYQRRKMLKVATKKLKIILKVLMKAWQVVQHTRGTLPIQNYNKIKRKVGCLGSSL